ncbi:Scr1 family TA system antitoxin-like transcriptional regulator [Actinocorallia populi]|uniref:Scr1 family TA system antitoxin-like transcriptional regulator n=1 Tax=Actinocorallia populi TaxID=2079200 RepID=UPI000D08726C|nr:Scr1 family TA system antitoxin-like transcriptional regulator [Actinocorallia populi]
MGAEQLRVVGERLRRLRVEAGLSGAEVARRAGVPQPTVSRVEAGHRVANAGIVMRLVEALRLAEAESRRLAELVRQAYEETAPQRADAGVSFRVRAAAELGATAREVRGFGASAVPAQLRTAEYAQAARLGGLRPTAGGGERRVEFVLSEAALRTWPGSGACMAGQLDHLLRVEADPSTSLGVLPLNTGLAAAPLHGFTVFDETAVSVETFTRELTLSGADEVRAYLDVYGKVRQAAVFGEEARELIERARRDAGEALRITR